MAKPSEYDSLESKRQIFGYAKDLTGQNEFLINTKEQFDNYYEGHSRHELYGKYVFRGLNNSRYKLYTTGQRFWMNQELYQRGYSYEEFIRKIMRLVRSENSQTISRFLQKAYNSSDDIGLLSFIQHYGGPTPLIDFTKNFNAALFFACKATQSNYVSNDSIDNYISLYSMSLYVDTEDQKDKRFWHEYWEQIKNEIEDLIEEQKLLAYKEASNVEVFFATLKNFKTVYIDQEVANLLKFQYITNANLLNQDGVFFFVNDEKKPFDEIIDSQFNVGLQTHSQTKFVNCIHLHKNLIPYILQTIKVNSDFIFPNYYSMMKSVGERILLE